MTTLTINGQKVKVSDDFLKLSPEQQNATVDEIAKSMGMQPATPPAQSPEMAAGLASMSAMTRNPAQALEAEQARRADSRTVGQSLYDNLIGDPNDGVDSFGERLGRGMNDAGKATGAGLARGAAGLAGLPGSLGNLFNQGMTAGGKAIGVIPEDWEAPNNPISGGGMIEGMSNLTGGATDYRGDSRAAKFAGTISEFLPGALAFGGGNNLIRFGVAPGAASEAAGQMTEGTAIEPYARFAGALAGGILPDVIKAGVSKVVSPYGGADPERLKLAQYLDDQGVPLTAGQRVGSEALRRKEGFTQAGQDLMETQAEAFTKAALKTTGTDAARATPEVLKAIDDRIGAVFDDVVKGVDVTPDPKAVTALSEAVSTYKSLAPTGNQAPIISNVFEETVTAMRGGNTIPAATLKVWRSNLSKLTASTDQATRAAAIEALEAVDDMMASALTSAGRAGDVARLAEARTQWRNFLAVQRAATGAGEGAAAGLISPSALRNATVNQGRASYAQGTRGDIADLARAGEGVIKKLPTSGTAENMRALMPSGVWGALGAAPGAMSSNPMLAMAGAAAGTMVPGALGAARMSGPVQAYLANQLMRPATTNIGKGAGLSALPFANDRRFLPQ
jgi:hypothetical protein